MPSHFTSGSGSAPWSELLLPAGAVLLHIGPYKTGSTSLQAALFEARASFEEFGVYYPGRWRRAMRPGWSAMQWAPRGRKVPPPELWEEFSADIRSRSDLRTCVSTEDFSSTAKHVERIVADLGAERVHVVAVARRLDRLLPSAWQERMKSLDERTFSDWLHEVLDDPASKAARSLWKSRDLAAVAERWLRVLPPERFHVVTTDDSDRELLFRVFEGMLGLPEGLLQETRVSNSSVSANAAELLRRLNIRFREEGWDDEFWHDTVLRGVIPGLADRPAGAPAQPIPRVPGWALPRLAELASHQIDGLRKLGVSVIGDLETLRTPTSAEQADLPEIPEMISIDEARNAVAGALASCLAASERAERRHRRELRQARQHGQQQVRPADLTSVGGRVLARALGQRVLARVRHSRPR